MTIEFWYLVLGVLLVSVAMFGSFLRDLPLTAAMAYFLLGIALGPLGTGALRIDAVGSSVLVERLAELGVIVSLFTAGLKLRLPFNHSLWWLPLRLAFLSMAVTVGLVALAGTLLLGLPLGAAVLLGAILAPTDPVLAASVHLRQAGDRDPLRFGLTGEAGLNDGAAFPFVMLGLGLLGLHELGEWGWRWVAVDVIWATAGGLMIGAVFGAVTAQGVIYLRRKHREGVGYDEFLAFGLIALSYGAAVILHAYGFLAVFAAGLALRMVERRKTVRVAGEDKPPQEVVAADQSGGEDPRHAPIFMAEAVLAFNQQIERVVELALVLAVGAMLAPEIMPASAIWFIPLLLLVIRPVAVFIGMVGSETSFSQRSLIGWLGIRGIGSIYYLAYVINHGVAGETAARLASLTVLVVAVSIFLHGASATPLMRIYEKMKAKG